MQPGLLCIYNLYTFDYRAFSCDVIAAMLEGKDNTFSLPWEIRSVFIVSALMAAVKTLYRRIVDVYSTVAHRGHAANKYQLLQINTSCCKQV